MSPRLLTSVLLAGLFVCVSSVRGQTFIWTGDDLTTAFLAGDNWQSQTPPSANNGTESISFGDIGNVAPTQIAPVLPGGGFAVNSLIFGLNRPNYTLNGPATLTLNGNVTLAAGNTVVFANTLGVAIANNTVGNTFNVAAATTLQIDGVVSGAGHFAKTGTGTLILTGTNTFNYVGGGGFLNSSSIHAGTVTLNGGAINHGTSGDIWVGQFSGDDGTLNILAGGDASGYFGVLGHDAGSTGTATVSGAGSTWTNSNGLSVGSSGSGDLTISNGGAVTVVGPNSTIAANFGSTGSVTVEGIGSTLSGSGNLLVGNNGDGSLGIFLGGTVSTGGYAVIGETSTSESAATLSGAGSTWNVGGDLYVGNGGLGQLYLRNQAQINLAGGSGTLHLAHSSGGIGTLSIGYDGEVYNAGGILNAATITTGTGNNGTVRLGTTATKASPYYLTQNGTGAGTYVTITGQTQVQHLAGYNVLGGTSNYSGGTIVNGGTLVAATSGALGSGTVQLSGGSLVLSTGVTLPNALGFSPAGGTIGGSGTFGSTMTIGTNVHLAPGNSVGTLTFSGGLTLASGGTLDLEVQSASGAAGSGYDLLSISGGPLNITATSANKFTLKIISLNLSGTAGAVSDFSAAGSYSWTIASSGTAITGFDPDAFTFNTGSFANALDGGIFSLMVSGSGNDLILNFTPVPEPSTYALILAGLGLAGFRHWRKRRA